MKLDYEISRLLLSHNKKVGKCRANFLAFRVQLEEHQNKNWENLQLRDFLVERDVFRRVRSEIGKRMKTLLDKFVRIRVLRMKSALTRCFVLTCSAMVEAGEKANEKCLLTEKWGFLFSFMALEKCSRKISYPLWFNKLVFQTVVDDISGFEMKSFSVNSWIKIENRRSFHSKWNIFSSLLRLNSINLRLLQVISFLTLTPRAVVTP